MMKQDSSNNDMQQINKSSENDFLRKLFLGGLSMNSTEDSIRAFYSQFGEVLDVVVMRDSLTKRSRGFGFVTFKDPSMVDKAQAARPHIVDGKAVDSKRALPRPEVSNESSVKKVFVGGLKDVHDEESLREHFEQFGKIISVKVLHDKSTGRKRGFGYVEFDDYDAVDKAVLHKDHAIKYVMVDVKKSNYKQELAKKLATQQQQGGVDPNAGMPAGNPAYQQPPNAYNPQAPVYGYPPAPAASYNGWGPGYPGATYPPQQPPAAYGAYVAPPAAGAPTNWNHPAPYGAPNPTWPQNNYQMPNAQATNAAAPASAMPATNGWNNTGAPPTAPTAPGMPAQNFGSYQQTYNGGPQKAGTLQANRMNPYSVGSASNYGKH